MAGGVEIEGVEKKASGRLGAARPSCAALLVKFCSNRPWPRFDHYLCLLAFARLTEQTVRHTLVLSGSKCNAVTCSDDGLALSGDRCNDP